MRDYLRSGCRFLRTGWFWAFVLIALPNCALDTSGWPCEENDPREVCQEKPPCEGPDCECDPDDPDCEPPCDPDDPDCLPPYEKVFKPGDMPGDSIMCDIPEPLPPGDLGCATPQEVASLAAFSQSEAATALNTGQGGGSVTFDWSAQAQLDCGVGIPKKVTFMGPYPQGLPVCLNCMTQIPNVYADPQKACVAKCEDLINLGSGVKPPDTHAYCVASARPSTNFGNTMCFLGGCTNGGNPGNWNPTYPDPRIDPEPVVWIDFLGTSDNGGTNTLVRTAPTTGNTPADFNAGAASAQTIKSGDAWVEFEVTETNTAHILGLHASCDDPANCPDNDASYDVGLGLVLFGDGQVFVYEGSLALTGPLGTYSVGERYRVRAVDKHDGTATISYSRLTAPCTPGTVCDEEVLHTSITTLLYPFRVDTSLRDQNSTLTNVTLVRIKQ